MRKRQVICVFLWNSRPEMKLCLCACFWVYSRFKLLLLEFGGCVRQSLCSPWSPPKLQLFYLNCIIKTGTEARETAPPHPIKLSAMPGGVPCTTAFTASQTHFLHTLSSFTFPQITFIAVCLCDITHFLPTFFSQFAPAKYWPVLQLLSLVSSSSFSSTSSSSLSKFSNK